MAADPIASVRRLLYRRLRVRPGPEGVRQRPGRCLWRCL